MTSGQRCDEPNSKIRNKLNQLYERNHVDTMEVQPEDAVPGTACAALLAAAGAGDSAQVAELLSAGANHTATDSVGRTSLYIAARAGHADTVKVLLQHGAAVDVGGTVQLTPLHVAACRGHGAVVKLLLQAGAAPDAALSSGDTALHIAAMLNYPTVAQLLCQHMSPAQVDAVNVDCGFSALLVATLHQHTDIAAVLLRDGVANPLAPCAKLSDTLGISLTPFMFAIIMGSVPIVETLLQHARPDKLPTDDLFAAAGIAATATGTQSAREDPNLVRAYQQIMLKILQAAQHRLTNADISSDHSSSSSSSSSSSAGDSFSAESFREGLYNQSPAVSAAMISSLLTILQQSEADLQAREAQVCTQAADVSAERIAVQHLVVSMAAAQKWPGKSEKRDSSSGAARRGGRRRGIGMLKVAAGFVLGFGCSALLKRL